MSRHRELKSKRFNLLSEIEELNNSIQRVNDGNRVHEITLRGLEEDQSQTIEKARKSALAEEINKNTFKHSEVLAKLQTKKEDIVNNREKRLSQITYEKYSKKTKDKLSVEDSLKRSEEIKSLLDEKMGKRLSSELSRIIPSNRSFNSLSEIQDAFNELEVISNRLTNHKDFMPRLEKMIFSYDTTEIDKNSTIAFVIVVVMIALMLIFVMPLFIVVLVGLFVYNVYKSYAYYNAMSIAKVLVTNITKINNSIEEGIKNRVKYKKSEIEQKFKLMLDKVDAKITTVEELISDTTSEVERDFVFNDSSIIESFKSKKDSLLEQIERNKSQINDYYAQIEKLKEEIKLVDREIAEEGKNVYNKYYPRDVSNDERSPIYLDDILLDVVDNEPSIFELPRGSAIFLYKDEDAMFTFINLYLASILCRMKVTSFYLKFMDLKYAGTKLINYARLDTCEQLFTEEAIKNSSDSINKEMMKRIKILGNKHIDDYNNEMIADDSAPMPYHVILDLFNKPNESNANLKQVIINGFKYGLIYNLFLDVREIQGDNKIIDFILNSYSEYYYISDQSVIKKSSKFLSSLKG